MKTKNFRNFKRFILWALLPFVFGCGKFTDKEVQSSIEEIIAGEKKTKIIKADVDGMFGEEIIVITNSYFYDYFNGDEKKNIAYNLYILKERNKKLEKKYVDRRFSWSPGYMSALSDVFISDFNDDSKNEIAFLYSQLALRDNYENDFEKYRIDIVGYTNKGYKKIFGGIALPMHKRIGKEIVKNKSIIAKKLDKSFLAKTSADEKLKTIKEIIKQNNKGGFLKDELFSF